MAALHLDRSAMLEVLKAALRDGWAELHETRPTDTIYGFGFAEMIEFETLSVVAYTEEYSSERGATDSPYDRYWPPQVGVELAMIQGPPLASSDAWHSVCEANGDEHFRTSDTWRRYVQTINGLEVRALLDVESEGLFGDRRENIVLFTEDLQGEDTVENLIHRALALNPLPLAERYIDRWPIGALDTDPTA